jgi:hypothetical protein
MGGAVVPWPPRCRAHRSKGVGPHGVDWLDNGDTTLSIPAAAPARCRPGELGSGSFAVWWPDGRCPAGRAVRPRPRRYSPWW